MKPRSHRAVAVLTIALVAAACTSPARTDAASLPPVGESSTLPSTTTTTTLPPPSTSTIPETGPDIVAWLNNEAAALTLAEATAAWKGVGAVELVAGEQALAEFASLYPDRPDLVEGVDASALPASLRVELTHPSFLAEVASQLRALTDVEEVTTRVTPACNPFFDWNIVLFVDDDRQLTRLRNELAVAEGITDITVTGREEAHAEYLERFAGFSDLATRITVQDMLVSLRAHTTNPVTLSLLARRFEGDSAVRGIQVFPPGATDCR